MVQESALSTTLRGETEDEFATPEQLRATGRSLNPVIAAAISEIMEASRTRKITRGAANMLVKAILPKRLPADISSLPERIETKAELATALDELMRLRREGMIDNTEWGELQEAVNRQYRLAQEAGRGR